MTFNFMVVKAEMSIRPGTLATHQIVGLAEAAKLIDLGRSAELQRLPALKRVFLDTKFETARFFQNDHSEDHFPGIFNFGFFGVDGETLLLAASKIAVSTGSACNSEKIEASHVLRGLGLTEIIKASISLGLSFGRYTTAGAVRCLRGNLHCYQSIDCKISEYNPRAFVWPSPEPIFRRWD